MPIHSYIYEMLELLIIPQSQKLPHKSLGHVLMGTKKFLCSSLSLMQMIGRNQKSIQQQADYG